MNYSIFANTIRNPGYHHVKADVQRFPKMWYFLGVRLSKGSYWPSKSTDIEIWGPLAKLRGVTKKRHGHNFDFSGLKGIAGVVHPISYLGYSFQA